MSGEDYLRQQLEWVKQRMEALDKAEAKLREMKMLAEYARDNDLNQGEVKALNARLHVLRKEAIQLYGESSVFWVDCQ
jgi:hypothetical protein